MQSEKFVMEVGAFKTGTSICLVIPSTICRMENLDCGKRFSCSVDDAGRLIYEPITEGKEEEGLLPNAIPYKITRSPATSQIRHGASS